MSDVRYQVVGIDEEGQRLDNYLFRFLKGVPKSHVYRIIRGGEVRVNKKRAKASSRVCSGDMIRIPPVRCAEEKEIFVGDKLEKHLNDCILFEDNSLLVINKPAGLAVHGGSGQNLGLIEALRKIRTDLTYVELVHRLDKETSGCLLIAKKRSALRAIQQLLMAREVKKTYWALQHGAWEGDATKSVDVPLQKNVLKSGERIVTVNEQGKPSQTTFTLLENYSNACWVAAYPVTGRTHQIRVHSAFIHHPIIGDDKYGEGIFDKEPYLEKAGLCLHARAIAFTLNGVAHRYEALPDKRFTNILTQLRTREKAL